MLSPEIIARIKSLSLRGRHLATDVMTGDYASAFHGRGMEFHEVREYVPGDDVRGIDWNVTARMNQPFIKIFREERELTLMLLVDVSTSLSVGVDRPRQLVAAELASILAWLAIRSNDRVGLLLFGEKIELYVPPRKGQAHVWRIIKDLLTWKGTSPGSNIALALDHLATVVKRRSVCFLVSDFFAVDYAKSLGRLAKQHDLTCVQMTQDPLDGIISKSGVGISNFVDLETGEFIELDASDKAVQSAIIAHHETRQRLLERSLRASGADYFAVRSDRSVVEPLADYLRSHGPRRRVR